MESGYLVQSLKHLHTEQTDARYANLDISDTTDILFMMNEADRTVPAVVGQALPSVALAVEVIVKALKQG
ncbi:MAG: N-acetylmuramic acid 6-phosphate etherase, partial [Bacilli bacterium]